MLHTRKHSLRQLLIFAITVITLITILVIRNADDASVLPLV